MKRITLRHWLLCGALSASTLVGCHQEALRPPAGCSCCNVPSNTTAVSNSPYATWSVAPGAPSPAPVQVATPPQELLPARPILVEPQARLGFPQGSDDAVVSLACNDAVVPLTSNNVSAPPSMPQPPVVKVSFEPPQEESQTPGPLPALPAPTVTAVPTTPGTVLARGESPPVRKSYVDLTAAPCFSHAPDYNWIIGQVEYSRIAKEWRLRYASVDELDEHGGRVILIENHHVSLLRDGQFIHARGHLVEADGSQPGPAHYRLESFKSLADSNAPETVSGAH